MTSKNHNPDYILQYRFSPEHAQVQFTGVFQKKSIIWHAHIRTLHDYCYHELFMPQQRQGNTIHAQPFIDIHIERDIHKLTVALNLKVIDDASILGTIIMIRQYKRLQTGRHEYGDFATFNFDSN